MTDRDRLIHKIMSLKKPTISLQTAMDIVEAIIDMGVIVPPCKVGDTVYTTLCYGIGDWRIKESIIVEIRKRLGFNLEIIERITNDKRHCTYLPIVLENFGVTKFLTKEEAKANIDKRGKGND